ncbi:MAG: DUF5666 domain-containing protein [Acidobacteriota bacterium]|nr:DUF5666 domain-containing protein [Acidobacteriota bacterium]
MKIQTCQKIPNRHSLWSVLAGCLAIAITGGLVACGGSNTGPSPVTTPTSAAKTVVQVNMGDAPADWMLAFSMNINSLALTGSNGTVSAVSSGMTMEMMHLMGTMQPLALIFAPQGTYTSASISISSAVVMYMDPATKSVVQKTITGPISATMTFTSPIVVGSTPMAVGFDLDLANSVTMDASGNPKMNPVFHVTSGMQGAGNPLDPSNGGIQHMMGAVSSTSSNSFSMTSIQAAQTFTFATNSSTSFDNITNMSMMTSGMLVLVDASMQSDGSLMATKVQSMMNAGGVMGSGVITSVTGQPATQLMMVAQNGAGTGMMSSAFASGASVNMSGSTVFQINRDEMDMSNLPFTLTFDATHIYAGQSVMPISSSGMGTSGGMMGGNPMGGSIASSGVTLEPQGLSGMVATPITSGSKTSFMLTLPSDCAFTTLTGATSVTVYQQPGTTMSGTSSIAGGATVHVFGLLSMDAGQWKMVAARIGAN